MLFLKAKKGEQARLLRELKEKTGLNWKKVARKMKVSRSMVFLYLNEKCKVPKFRLELLCSPAKSKLKNYNLDFINENINEEKQITEAVLCEKLSEFLGILSGDGCLENKSHAVTVTCGKTFDEKYIRETISPMFNRLFGVLPKVFYGKGVIKCRVYSKRLCEFISNEYDFPIGEKKGKLKIPLKYCRMKNC